MGAVFATVAAAALAVASAAAVRVAVDLHRPIREVPPLAVAGFNFNNSMRVIDLLGEMEALRIRSIRFPAGNAGDERDRTPLDLDVLRRHWILLGRPAVVMQARVLGGTPEGAAEAAREADRIGLPIAYWEIGNEPDLYPPAGSWTPESYCELFRQYVAALSPVAPGARFAGPAVSGGGHKMEWVRRFVAACGDVVDVVTWHVYPTDGTWTDAEALATSEPVSAEIEQVRSWIDDPAHNPLGWRRAGRIGLGITEFGLSWRSPNFRHLADFTAALWTADVVGRILEGGLELSGYFALQGTGGHGLLDSAGFTRPTYPLFRMVRDFKGAVVRVQVEPAVPGLSVYAVRDAETLRVLLVNRSPGGAYSLSLQGAAGEVLRVAAACTLTRAGFEAQDDCEPVDTEGSLSLLLAPSSVTVALAALDLR